VPTSSTFAGFPKHGLQFYKNLAANNNREWFNAHKQEYLDDVQAPAVDFVIALGERLKRLSKTIGYDTRTNGAGSIMRIYRDIRFSKDKTPYKTNLGIAFAPGGKKKTESPGFYFHMEADHAVIYTGLPMLSKEALAAYRDAVADDKLGKELERALASIRRAGKYEIGGEQSKRVPTGYDPEHMRADLLRYKGLYARSPSIKPAVLTSRQLVDVCFEHCRVMLPLQRWFAKVDRIVGT
jgi:uncharacterized protein (TIGR02453 family)